MSAGVGGAGVVVARAVGVGLGIVWVSVGAGGSAGPPCSSAPGARPADPLPGPTGVPEPVRATRISRSAVATSPLSSATAPHSRNAGATAHAAS